MAIPLTQRRRVAVLWAAIACFGLLGSPSDIAIFATSPAFLANAATADEQPFWSFRALARPTPPTVATADPSTTPLDRFVLARLEERGLTFAAEADRRMLIRRLSLDLLGLPPTPAEVEQFLSDRAPDAYERLVDRYLASPQYGERWGRQWLDVVGYSDSNGYIRHDTPRPLAWRYRDYVIHSLNDDKPYDQWWREQLAGDELVDDPAAPHLSTADRDKLIATHFLRNAPDGTDTTEGNEITRVMERYAVLESQLQITMSAMFGMTIECARCHSHKFDPIPQRDYYSLQAIFYPAFNVKDWKQPKDRWIYAAGPADVAAWRASNEEVDRDSAALRAEFNAWVAAHRPPGHVLYRDDFSGESLAAKWSDTAPGDDTPAGNPPVRLDRQEKPAARIQDGRLAILAAPPGDTVWLVTNQAFDWTPNHLGDWIQATFDLVDLRGPEGQPAERVGYYIALYDYDDSRDATTGSVPRGNILFDGNPAGGAPVVLDYPGKDQRGTGVLGKTGYSAGHNFGVRITRVGDDQFLLEHLVDGQPEQPSQQLTAEQLPDGGFGFELCCSRSFVVDNVVIESSLPESEAQAVVQAAFAEKLTERKRQLSEALAMVEKRRLAEPDRIAWATDLSPNPPVVPLLKRGDYFQQGPAMDPGPLSVLADADNAMPLEPPPAGAKTTGRRLAFARWATQPGSRAAALLARVEVDRLWRGHFGQGLVSTPENFGASGVPPTHPELLEWLAGRLVDQGWRLKPIHREIVLSRTYRQTSVAEERAIERDPDNQWYSRFPAHRLEAESIRDCLLAAAGTINLQPGGPAIEYVDPGTRQIVLPAPTGPGPHEVDRRSIYIRHRRSQPLTFLQVFDQAAPDPNCVARAASTNVAQSLAMLNGDFAVRMGREFAARIEREAGPELEACLRQAFLVALAREPDDTELATCREFLRQQSALRAQTDPSTANQATGRSVAEFVRIPRAKSDLSTSDREALADFCRMLLATNEFIQVQ